ELTAGSTRSVELALTRGACVQGVVRDAQGAPIAGARIRAGHALWLDDRATSSSVDGSYRLENVPAGEVELAASLDNGGRAQQELRAADGASLEWNPRLDPGLVLAGRVVDERGLALAGLELAAFTGGSEPGAPHSFQRVTRTGADGSFRVVACPEEA